MHDSQEMGYSTRNKPTLKTLVRRNAWAILVLAVLQQWETSGKGVTSPFASENFTVSPETIVKAMSKVGWRLSVYMAQRSDNTVRGTCHTIERTVRTNCCHLWPLDRLVYMRVP